VTQVLDAVLDEVGDLPQFRVEAGVDVVVAGDDRGQLLILVEGAVEVRRDGVVLDVVDEPGSVFGEVATLMHGPPTATVRTLRPSLFRGAGDPHTVLENSPMLTLAVAELLARRLDTTSQQVVDLTHEKG
jgi:CRP-like cAMP-binding protein